jgi:Ca2+-binding RTX toxin-like protein
MYGEEGNDVLDSGMIGESTLDSDTTMIGGVGDDWYFVDSVNDVVVEEVGGGVDTITSFFPYTLPDDVENFSQLSGQFVTGNALDNEIWGNNYEFNVIDGRAGADRMHGRFGDDTYIVDNIGDVVIEDNVWDGTDTVQSSVTFALPIYVEHLILTGSQAVDGSGNAVDNSLTGNNAPNTLAGGLGNDTLHGGLGDDTYIFNLGDGIDTLEDLATAAEGNRIQFGTEIAQADLTFSQTGTSLDIIVGSEGDRVRLLSFDPSNATGSLVVSTLQFSNGGIINLADLFSTTVNHAPAVANPLADQTVPEDAPFSLTMPANTFADEDIGDVLTYSAALADGNALPTWLTFDSAIRTFNGMPDDAQVGSWDLRVTVGDSGDLTVSDVFTLTVTGVNEAPIAAMPITDQQAMEDTLFNFVMSAGTFADVDGGDILTYSATLANGDALPVWLGFDASTGSFSGIPTNGDVGSLNVAVVATDLAGLSVTNSFTLTVHNVNDAPIVANALADQGAAEDSPFSLRIPSTTFDDVDIVHADQLTYGVAQADGRALPTWLSFEADSQTLAGTPGPGDAGLLQIAVTATDQFALTVSGPLPKILTGTFENDVLTGGRGSDVLSGLSGNDQLIGREGNDLLDGGTGSDTMQGGLGNDTYLVDNTGDAVTENANEGIDTVQASITYTLGANLENLTLTGSAAINGTGNALNNALVGNAANNRLIGGAGNDRIDGGVGSDTMLGGTGNDTYSVNQAGDVVTENFNEGMDTVESGVSYTLGSNVENLTLSGTAQISGTGNVLNNILTGNSGNNVLDGGAANDTVDGGAGNDSLLGGSGDDILLGGSGDDALAAGSGNDVLDGGDGTDTLDGGAGDDTLRGGAGDDSLTGGSGGDQLLGGLGNDMLIGGSGNDLYNFSRGDGQDTVLDSDLFPSNQDRLLFATTINPLDLVISRQANDLRLALHGTTDSVTIRNWYLSPTTNQIEDLVAGNGQHLLNTQVDQLIQAMGSFSQQTGLTWDQAIEQQPQQVHTILAASWH